MLYINFPLSIIFGINTYLVSPIHIYILVLIKNITIIITIVVSRHSAKGISESRIVHIIYS